MKYVVAVVAFVFFSSLPVKAQGNAVSADSLMGTAQGNAIGLSLRTASSYSSLPLLPSQPPEALPQVVVQSVFPEYSFQAYADYTFIRFYAYPGGEANRNGLGLGISYYPQQAASALMEQSRERSVPREVKVLILPSLVAVLVFDGRFRKV